MIKEPVVLINVEQHKNEYGELAKTISRREVLAEEQGVSQREHFQGMATGLKPDIVFMLSDYLDYEDEPFVEVGTGDTAKLYKVYRTGRRAEETEILLFCTHLVNRAEVYG